MNAGDQQDMLQGRSWWKAVEDLGDGWFYWWICKPAFGVFLQRVLRLGCCSPAYSSIRVCFDLVFCVDSRQ